MDIASTTRYLGTSRIGDYERTDPTPRSWYGEPPDASDDEPGVGDEPFAEGAEL